MIQLLKAFKAEGIKLKHSGIKTTAYLLAVIPMLLGIGMSIYEFFSDTTEPTEPVYLFFDTYNQLTSAFIELFYPLIIIVTASRIAQLEHRNNTWQLMETQPVNRAILLNAKFLKAYQICFFSIVIFMLGVVLLTWFDYLLSSKSELYILNIDWLFLVKKTISLTFGTGFLLALIYAISVRFSNLFISIIVGVGMLLVAPILNAFNLLPKWFPTTILKNCLKVSSDLGYWLTYNEYLSVIGTVAILFIITFWYVFKNRKWWVTNKTSAVLNFAVPILILLGLFLYVNHPTQLTQSNETVIKGVVPEKSMISALYLLDGTMNDTLQIIPVKDNRFHHVVDIEDLPLKKYRLAYTSSNGNMQKTAIVYHLQRIKVSIAQRLKVNHLQRVKVNH